MRQVLKLFKMTVLDPAKIGLSSSPTGITQIVILGVDENTIRQWVVNTFRRDRGFSEQTKITFIEEITGPFDHGTILWRNNE